MYISLSEDSMLPVVVQMSSPEISAAGWINDLAEIISQEAQIGRIKSVIFKFIPILHFGNCHKIVPIYKSTSTPRWKIHFLRFALNFACVCLSENSNYFWQTDFLCFKLSYTKLL